MKVPLTLTRKEFEAFLAICTRISGFDCDELTLLCYRRAMTQLRLKVADKLVSESRAKYRIVLSEIQVLALYHLLPSFSSTFGAFALVLAQRILADIDKEFHRQMAFMNSLKRIN